MTKCLQTPLLFLIFIPLLAIRAMGQTQSTFQQTPSASATNLTRQALDLGELDGTDYVNNSFRLSLSIPREWVVATAQRRTEFDEQLKKMVKAPDQKQLDRVQDSIERSKTLLRITKLPEGQPNNAQFALIAERLASPSMKTGLDVIEAMRQTMKGSNFTVEFLGEVRTETLGTAEFGVADVKVTSSYGNYRQRIYTTVRGEYALELFFTYLNDADLPAFSKIVKSVKIK
jgi:hypothetical protein